VTNNPPPKALILGVLIAQVVLGLATLTICLPSMQEWSEQLDAPPSTVQLTLGLYALAYGVMQLVWGPLSDRVGRRSVMLAGLALLLLGLIVAALSQGVGWLVAARVLQGVGAAAGAVAARASVNDLFDGGERARVMGMVGMAMGLTPPLATLVGGTLHERVGWQANFALLAVVAFGLLIVAWRVLPRLAPGLPATPARSMASVYLRLASTRGFAASALVVAFTTATFYAFLGAAPFVLKSQGVGPARMGWFMMVLPLSYIVGNYLTTRLVRKHAAWSLMSWGQSMTLVGIVLMMLAATAGFQSPWAFCGPLVLLGLGHGLIQPSALTRTVGMVAGLAGAASAVAGASQQLLGGLAGYAVGLLSHHNAVNLGWVMLACTLMAWLMMHLAHRNFHGLAADPSRSH
jgi:MFS transporter, DHA1 family, multidrug resistance protein